MILLLAISLYAAPPTSLDCVDAWRKRNDLAVRLGVLLRREVDRGSANRAEIGAQRSIARRREWLVACPSETEL